MNELRDPDKVRKQMTAIKMSADLGKRLQAEHPEIAGSYREGRFLREIVDMYDLNSKYGVNDGIAMQAIKYALRGYEGIITGEYSGLIEEDELRELCLKHKSRNGSAIGENLYSEGRGIFSLTIEQMLERSALGGSIGGRRAFEKGKGIHGMTHDGHIEAGRRAQIARGRTPYSDDEKRFIYRALEESKFKYQSGNHRGQVNLNLLAREVNILFHGNSPIRNADKVRNLLYDNKKREKSIVS